MTTKSNRALRNAIATVVVAGGVGFVVWGIVRDAGEVRLEGLAWSAVAFALAALLLAYVLRALSFGVLVRTLDRTAPFATSARVFLAAQLGRYIPGKVWQVAGAGYFASRLGTSPAASVIGTAYYVVIHNLVGALLGLWVVLRIFPKAQSNRAGVALVVVALASIAFASSPAFSRLMAWLGRKAGRELQFEAIPVWGLLFTVASSLCVWVLFGVAVTATFAAVAPAQPTPTLFDAVTHMAAASVAGLAVLVAPSGIGVREAVFVAAFAPSVPLARAGLVALLLRILMSLVEVLLASLSLIRAPK